MRKFIQLPLNSQIQIGTTIYDLVHVANKKAFIMLTVIIVILMIALLGTLGAGLFFS